MMQDPLTLVERGLFEAVQSDVEILANIGAYIMATGGKRLRPRVVLLAHEAAGGADSTDVVPLAVAVELLHVASLIHDDINDSSPLRRGQATVNMRWDSSLALLAGDFVFVKLLQVMAVFEPWAIRALAAACLRLVEGETLQVASAWDSSLSEEGYLQIIERKTAALFSTCAELAARWAHAPESQIAGLRAYGLNLGIAFQMTDDILDLDGRIEQLGKPVHRDLEQGKPSLAVLYTLRRSQQALEAFRQHDDAKLLSLVQSLGGIDYARTRVEAFVQEARAALAALPTSKARCALDDLASRILRRET
jgi:geranylgeranyl pyrophosphate synthase